MAYADLAEFFFAAHPAVVQLQTIEITHPNFTTPFRFVRNDPNGIRVFHEGGDGPFVYSYLPMEIKTLGTTTNLDQSMEITLGDLGQILPSQLQILSDGNGFQTKPILVYREYRSDEYAMQAIGAPDWTFDGVDDVIAMGDVLDFERTDPFSVTSWGYSTTALSGAFIAKQNAAGVAGWRMASDTTGGDGFTLTLENGSGGTLSVDSTSTFADGFEHFVGATYDGSSSAAGVQLYMDGGTTTQVTSSNTLASGSTLNAVNLQIGKRGVSSSRTGSVHDVAVWDRVLTSGEMAEVYGGGTAPDLLSVSCASALVGWWKVDADDAQGLNGVIDYSVSGFNGTAAGGIGALTGNQVPVYIEPMIGPFTLQINSLAFNKLGCTLAAKPRAFNRARTGEIYDIGRFPMLAGFL